MANYKGITIDINGNPTPLIKALSKVNKETKALDREIKKVDRALKFNPTSVNLWREKQKLLSQQIEDTRKKLDHLKQAQAQMDANNVDKESEEYKALQREIALTESELKKLENELRKIGNVSLKALSNQFKEVGGKIKDVGGKLTRLTLPLTAGLGASVKASLKFGDAMAKVSTIADETEVPIKDLSKGILELSNTSGKGATELAEATYQALSASVSTKDAIEFVTSATGLAKAGFLETADAVDILTTVINAYGYEAEDATKIANELIQTQNDGKTTVNELASAMGQVIPTASALNIPLEQLNASYVLLTKQGINTANSTTYLNGMFNELAKDGSKVSSILKDKTGKTFGELMQEGATLGDVMQILNESVDGNSEAFLNLWSNTRAGKGALALLNGGVEEFNAEVVKMQNSTGNVANALEDLATPGASARKALNQLVNVGIQIGDVLAPYILKASEFIQKLVDKFNSLSPEAKKVIVIIASIIAVIGPLMTVIGSLISGVGALIGVIGMISAPMLAVAGVIAGVIAVGVLLYKNWDTIKAKAIAFKNNLVTAFNDLKNKVTTAFNSIKNAIVNPIQTAINTVKSLINKIKGFFPISIGKVMSNLKLPHFKLKGKFDLKTLSVPKISVEWYKTGGIFDSPSVIGVGEAGAEAVVPLNKLWEKLDNIASASGEGIVINVYGTPSMDVNDLAIAVERRLALLQKQREMVWI